MQSKPNKLDQRQSLSADTEIVTGFVNVVSKLIRYGLQKVLLS
jgi:hypothetical protein